jgi:hypothetical protein
MGMILGVFGMDCTSYCLSKGTIGRSVKQFRFFFEVVIFLGIVDHAGTHRIQMNLRRQFQQVGVGIYKNSFIPSLEEMTAPFPSPVYPARIAEGEVLHDARQRDVPHLNGHVDMVCQLAKSQHPVAEPLNSFLDEKRKPAVVRVVKEDVLSGISTKNDVIQRAGIMNAWFAWHGIKIASISKLAILQA